MDYNFGGAEVNNADYVCFCCFGSHGGFVVKIVLWVQEYVAFIIGKGKCLEGIGKVIDDRLDCSKAQGAVLKDRATGDRGAVDGIDDWDTGDIDYRKEELMDGSRDCHVGLVIHDGE